MAQDSFRLLPAETRRALPLSAQARTRPSRDCVGLHTIRDGTPTPFENTLLRRHIPYAKPHYIRPSTTPAHRSAGNRSDACTARALVEATRIFARGCPTEEAGPRRPAA